MSASIPAIVLAAGASRRLGQPKQLLKLDGETLVERAVRLANEAGAAPVIAVLGAHYQAIRAAVALEGAIHILNDEWEQGIASSIRAGIDALDAIAREASGVLILSCDQPRLTAGHLHLGICLRCEATRGRGRCWLCRNGRWSHCRLRAVKWTLTSPATWRS